MTVEQGLRAEFHDRPKELARALRAAREQGKLNETWRNILAAFIWRSTKEGHEYWLWTYTNCRNPDQYLPEGYVDVEDEQPKEQSPWISVEKRLPNENTNVVVVTHKGRMDIMRYFTKDHTSTPEFYFRDFGKWVNSTRLISKWMEIPKP